MTAIEDGEALPSTLGGLIDLRALDAPPDVRGALAQAKASLWLAKEARSSLLDAARAGGAFFLVVTDVSHGSPVNAATHGLLKTAALEWPEVACCVLDLCNVDASAAVRAELRCGFRDLEVLRREDGRFVTVVTERAVAGGSPVVTSRSVIVASGGARGVTATTLLALAQAARPALLLLGRTPLVDEPACCLGVDDESGLKKALLEDAKRSGRAIALKEVGAAARQVLGVREIRAFLAEVTAVGARVMYRAVDVRRVDEVAAACSDARGAFGPITGIVHGAGVLADKRIEDKTAEQVDRVMDTKVLGLHALLEATRADPLELIALFSSVAGRYGNVGQVDYAMANEALNEMAVRLRTGAQANPPLVKSFNWGPWEGGMVTPALKKIFRERGVAVLAHADGARHFVDELVRADDAGAGNHAVEVVFGGELSLPVGATAERAAADAGDSTDHHGSANETAVHLHVSTSPAYADHAVAGVVVLPAAGALAIMAGATGATSFTDVRVLRGVKLPRFFDEGHALTARTVSGAQRATAGAAVTLREAGAKAPNYSAVVASPRSHAALVPARATPGAAADHCKPYASLLFHGPRFHLVDAIESMGEDGCLARVHGCLDAGWGQDLALDVGALDAALQLALLWARHRTGGAYLPTAIARVDASAPRAGALQAIVRGRSCDEHRAIVDVQLLAAGGEIVCSLLGIEVHRLADDAAFAPAPALSPGARP